MNKHYSLQVITSNRDYGCSTPYPDLPTEVWQSSYDGLEVLYSDAERLNMIRMFNHIRAVKPRFLYLNSMFSLYFSITPLLFFFLNLIDTQIILAPRGMLKSSALQFKSFKKKCFLLIFRWTGLPRKIKFHATDQQEKEDIQNIFGPNCKVRVVSSFPSSVVINKLPKMASEPIRFIFLGRIHPIKNLHIAISSFHKCSKPVEINIIGSIEDDSYWKYCQTIASLLPKNITLNFIGELPHPQVVAILPKFDFLILPTQGENFGHAIFECLAAGLPVVISDQTPWKDLEEKRVGWVLPLIDESAFSKAVNEAVNMSREEYALRSNAAQRYAWEFIENARLEEAYLELFS